MKRSTCALCCSVLLLCTASNACAQASSSSVRDRLWIWGHPSGVYNSSYLAPIGVQSTIEPVAAADYMGIRNMIFVRYLGAPQPPFEDYYRPFRSLQRVYWSLVGADGATSAAERQHVMRLAEQNENICGFILDDFFHERPAMWLAESRPAFPVTLVIRPPQAVVADQLELVQTASRSGEFRSKEVTLEVSQDGQEFRRFHRLELPNQPGDVSRVPLSADLFKAIRIQIHSTHDTKGALSGGLQSVGFLNKQQRLNTDGWQVTASSSKDGFPATDVFRDDPVYSASLSVEQLATLRRRSYRGQQLPITAVVYAHQLGPWLKPYLSAIDQVSFWTWRPADLDHLENNLSKLQKLVPDTPMLLGCYMYDFDARRPLEVSRMKRQVEIGYRWLSEDRLAGMIFLGTPTVGAGLESVEWTRNWIAELEEKGE